jgi:hypothetical protein
MNNLSRLVLLAALALAAALTGCSSSSTEEPPQASAATYPITLEMRELEQVVGLRDVAVEIETEQCMINQGFPRVDRVSFAQNRLDRPTAAPLQAWTNVRPDSDTAAELGFNSLPIASLIENSSQQPTYPELEAMTEAEQQNWHTALLGTPDDTISYSGPGGISGGFAAGGCYGTARLALFEAADGGFGSFLVQRSMLENLRNDVYERVESGSAVRDALEDWRRCMSEAGYAEYQEPNEVVPTLAQLAASSDKEGELALTVIDAACFDESQLIETWDAETARLENELSQTDQFVTIKTWGDQNYPLLIDAFSPIIDARQNGTG